MRQFDYSGKHNNPDGYLKSGIGFWTLPDGSHTTNYGEWVVEWMKEDKKCQ